MSRIKSREEGVREAPAEIQELPSAEDELRRWADRAARNWRFRQSLLPQPRTQPGQIELALERIRQIAIDRRTATVNNGRVGAASTGPRRDAAVAGNGRALSFRGAPTEGGSDLGLQTPSLGSQSYPHTTFPVTREARASR